MKKPKGRALPDSFRVEIRRVFSEGDSPRVFDAKTIRQQTRIRLSMAKTRGKRLVCRPRDNTAGSHRWVGGCLASLSHHHRRSGWEFRARRVRRVISKRALFHLAALRAAPQAQRLVEPTDKVLGALLEALAQREAAKQA